MLDVRIRQAGIDDLPEILRQRRGMFYDAGYTDSTALDAMQETSEPYIRETLLSGTFVAWIAERIDSEPMGCGAVLLTSTPSHPLDPQCRRAVILNVYTYPRYRRQGIARRLMTTMITWCRRQDLASVSLHASRDGRALYESLGFQPTSEMRLSLGPNPRRQS
jgi:ribosomal protein S18 acetylase RimI-like enzyme